MWAPTALALVVHLGVQFLSASWGLRRATYKLRHARYFYARMPWQQRPRKVAKWEQHPPVPQGSPLLWKEMHLSGQTSRFVRSLEPGPGVVWLCVVSVFTLVGWAAVVGESADVLASMNDLIRWGGGLMVGLMAVMVGLHAAGSVARERQQETLTDLLTVPRPRREILAAKWVGSLSKARGIAIGTAAIPLVGVIAEALSFWAVVPLIAGRVHDPGVCRQLRPVAIGPGPDRPAGVRPVAACPSGCGSGGRSWRPRRPTWRNGR